MLGGGMLCCPLPVSCFSLTNDAGRLVVCFTVRRPYSLLSACRGNQLDQPDKSSCHWRNRRIAPGKASLPCARLCRPARHYHRPMRDGLPQGRGQHMAGLESHRLGARYDRCSSGNGS
ncbi:hypothetical protein HDV57DRAFT_486756 [Trichoderma longibrachiatum]